MRFLGVLTGLEHPLGLIVRAYSEDCSILSSIFAVFVIFQFFDFLKKAMKSKGIEKNFEIVEDDEGSDDQIVEEENGVEDEPKKCRVI